MSFWSQSWWVLLFCVLAGGLHVHFMREKKGAVHLLTLRLAEMENEKGNSLQMGDDLRLRIASQSDPAWIQMILMRDLGVVPEGFLKVHFKK